MLSPRDYNRWRKDLYWQWIFRMIISLQSLCFHTSNIKWMVVQNWPKSRANQDHLSCRCEINLDTETETEAECCNSVYFIYDGGNAKIESETSSKRANFNDKPSDWLEWLHSAVRCCSDFLSTFYGRLYFPFIIFNQLCCHILYEFNPI